MPYSQESSQIKVPQYRSVKLEVHVNMKRKFKQWWSTNPPISTKQTTTSHHKQLNIKKKTMTYDIRNPCLGLVQAQKYGRVKPVNVICFVSMTLKGTVKTNLSVKENEKTKYCIFTYLLVFVFFYIFWKKENDWQEIE